MAFSVFLWVVVGMICDYVSIHVLFDCQVNLALSFSVIP
jgi:hypothetical protein